MMKYARLFTLFLLFVFYTSGNAQNKTDLPKNKIKSATKTKDVHTSYGPNYLTRMIKQDRKGNIWIASLEGIIRYDGKSFTNITSNITSSRFVAVLEDRKGNFWFASVGSGVYYYDGKSFRNFTTREGLANNRVTCIYEDKTGNIWFGTESGASCYDGKSFRTFTMDEALFHNGATSLTSWFGTEGGTSCYDGKLFRNLMMNEALPHNDVTTITEDQTGKFWFGTRCGVYLYDGKTFTIFKKKDGKPFEHVRSIIEDKKGHIWIGGTDGLWRYDGSAAADFTQRGFTNFTRKFVGYIYEDKKGTIWTSSESADSKAWALSRYDAKSLSAKKATATEILSQEAPLFGILEDDDGNIWFGSNGVYRYDGNTVKDFRDKTIQKRAMPDVGC